MLEDYAEDISYDANGNILTYFRNGDQNESGIEMDNLTYQYERDLEGQLITNRLRYVHDEVQSNSYTADIKTQTSLSQQQVIENLEESQAEDNYQYDETGNLISDVAEGIDRIEWTVYGKIRKITKGTTTIEYGYDAGGNRISKIVDDDGTVVTTFYVRDAQGNVLAVYDDTPGDSYVWREQHLYGSSRLGMVKPEWKAPVNPAYNPTSDPVDNGTVGKRVYELTNHLGNVLVTISDIKIGKDAPGGAEIDYYEADVMTAQDYYPFGMGMSGRKFSGSSLYRYGFNGKENDNETGYQDYGMRTYDPLTGRFISVDPITAQYPELTPYQFASNRPIDGVDMDGLEWYYSNNLFNSGWKMSATLKPPPIMATDAYKQDYYNRLGYLTTDQKNAIQNSVESRQRLQERIKAAQEWNAAVIGLMKSRNLFYLAYEISPVSAFVNSYNSFREGNTFGGVLNLALGVGGLSELKSLGLGRFSTANDFYDAGKLASTSLGDIWKVTNNFVRGTLH